ncbi:unnamed protein product, partial [Callosobruchus maculatus]
LYFTKAGKDRLNELCLGDISVPFIRNDKPEFESRVLITTLIKHLRNNVNNCYIARWYGHMLTEHEIASSNPTTDQVFFKYINHVVQYYDVT